MYCSSCNKTEELSNLVCLMDLQKFLAWSLHTIMFQILTPYAWHCEHTKVFKSLVHLCTFYACTPDVLNINTLDFEHVHVFKKCYMSLNTSMRLGFEHHSVRSLNIQCLKDEHWMFTLWTLWCSKFNGQCSKDKHLVFTKWKQSVRGQTSNIQKLNTSCSQIILC